MPWDDLAPRAIASLARDLQLTPQQAAGVIGQLGYESAGLQAINEMQPVVPGSRGGFGWAQWTGPRRQQFEQWAQQSGMDINSPDANYGFLLHELQGPEGAILEDLRKTPDAQTAGRLFTQRFLRPGIPNQDNRDGWVQRAVEFLVPSAEAAEVPQQQDAGFASKIEQARQAGYSDDEIRQYLGSNEGFAGKLEQARQAGYSDDEIWQHFGLGGQAQEAPPEEEKPEGRSFMGNLGRQVGLTARYGLEGFGQLLDLGGRPIQSGLNAIGLPADAPSTSLSKVADLMRLPSPETGLERVVGDTSRLMAGAGGGVGLLSRGAQIANPGVARNVMGMLAEGPGVQIASAAGSGAGSGIAREMGGGAKTQMAAGLLGGLAAGGLTSAAVSRSARRSAENAVPSAQELKQQAAQKFEDARQLGITASGQETRQLATDMRGLAQSEGLISPTGRVSEAYPKAREALRLLDDYSGGTMNVPQMQTVRKVLADAAGSADKAERRMATIMLKRFDDFTAPMAPELAEARTLYTRAMRGEQLDNLRELATTRKSQFSGSGFENALRSEYRNLNKKIIKGQERGFTPAQQRAIAAVADGTLGGNAARYVGKLAPTGVVSTALGGGVPYMIGNAIGGPMLGGPLGIGALAVGFAGRNAATRSTSELARQAELLARGLLAPDRVGGVPIGYGLLSPERPSTEQKDKRQRR